MTTLAIVGAGPGLGMAVARRFGAEGFSVGLLSRGQERADGLAAQLVGEGCPRGASPPMSETPRVSPGRSSG
jgi:short-subunit dehydrogenase